MATSAYKVFKKIQILIIVLMLVRQTIAGIRYNLYDDPQTGNEITAEGSDWNYRNVDKWGEAYPECDGNRQSPIKLNSANSIRAVIPPLLFHNYNIALSGQLNLTNNGHSANLDIPYTSNGNPATISGANLLNSYKAIGVHFHWGSSNNKGSEHIIDNQRYDVEMHIVHQNTRYADMKEALKHKDGLTVLGVMLQMVNNPDYYYPGLNKIFNRLPDITQFEAITTLQGSLTMSQLLGDLNTRNFFTYKGSLTTPPCAESVTWIVFPNPLLISVLQIQKFLHLLDPYNMTLLNNFRPVQPLEGRNVYHRIDLI